MRRFSLHVRHGIYYAQLYNAAAERYMGARSTGCTSRDEAIATVTEWLRDGLPAPHPGPRRVVKETFQLDRILKELRTFPFREDDVAQVVAVLKDRGFIDGVITKAQQGPEPFVDFLRRFWSEDGPYIRERKAYGHAITKRHWREAQRIVEHRWAPSWAGIRLCDVKRNDPKAFLIRESEAGHAASTVNKTYAVASVALRWAFRNELIPSDPSSGVPRFGGEAAKRGILEPDEVRRLFELEWDDTRFKAAFAVAVTTGARLGEVLALRPVDVLEDRLRIEHGWNADDRLKTTKTRETREVPLLPSIRKMLLDLAAENPHGPGPERFIFYGRYPEGPIDGKLTPYHFKKAMERIGIDEASRKEHALTFHGLRHYFAKHMADRLDARKVMQATGHKTEAMLDHYADHRTEEDLGIIRGAAEELFGRILSFKKAAGE